MMRSILTILFLIIFVQKSIAKELNIVSTIKPIHSLVENIINGVTTTDVLLDGKQSIHSAQLRPSQMSKLNKADIVFYMDRNFETFTKSSFKNLPPSVKLVSLFDEEMPRKLKIRKLNEWHIEAEHDDEHFNGSYDYHAWLNPENAAAMIQRISETLIENDPEHKDIYEKNTINVMDRLTELNQKLFNDLTPLSERAFTVFHDGYQYFDDYYDLNIVGAFTINPALGLSPRHLSKMKKIIAENNVVCAFSEPYMNENILRNLQTELSLKTMPLDPEGVTLAPSKDLYFSLMDNMGHAIESCLKTQNQ